MSLFISLLAFEDAGLLRVSKIGLLAGSTISAITGLALLATARDAQ